jgi:hypothetical protein
MFPTFLSLGKSMIRITAYTPVVHRPLKMRVGVGPNSSYNHSNGTELLTMQSWRPEQTDLRGIDRVSGLECEPFGIRVHASLPMGKTYLGIQRIAVRGGRAGYPMGRVS